MNMLKLINPSILLNKIIAFGFVILVLFFSFSCFSINTFADTNVIPDSPSGQTQTDNESGNGTGSGNGSGSGTATTGAKPADPCSIAFCIGGVQNNERYKEGTPGLIAAKIIADGAFFLTVITSSLAIFYIVWQGFNMLSAAGDSGKFKTALNGIFYAILGLVISVIAYGVITSLIGFISNTSI